MVTVVEYEAADGSHPFAAWFGKLDTQAALKVRTGVARMESGNFSNAKSVGQGVHEYRIDFGPGYRIYFGHDGDKLLILLAGGTKKRQQRDIKQAKAQWRAYKARKRMGQRDGFDT